ncbi:MAG: ABC transporter ATP-binding protein [Abditibacteriota bacterium]|nr:ABC transporter ATP-binding protein [Abditibacteriota bacterium]
MDYNLNMKRLAKYVFRYKSNLIAAGLFGLLMAFCNLVIAAMTGMFVGVSTGKSFSEIGLIKTLTDFHLLPPNLDISPDKLTVVVAAMLFLIAIPRSLCMYFNNYLIAAVTGKIGADVRFDMYSHIHSLPLKFFHKSRIGDMLSRMNNDVGLIQNAGNIVMMAIDGPLMIVLGLGRMFMICWQLSLLTIVVIPLMAGGIGKLARRIRTSTTVSQVKLADVSSTLEESIRGIRIIKGFGMENHEISRFGKVNKKSLAATLWAAKKASVVAPMTEFMGSASVAALMLVGGKLMVNGVFSFDVLAEFITLAFMVSSAFRNLARLNVQYQQTMAGADRIFDLLDMKSDMYDKPDAKVLTDVKAEIEFKDVFFSYNPGEPVLTDISFKINPGEILAIVGPSGAGKSTVADLIARFYDVSKGAITVDGNDLRDVTMASLRKYMAIVPQETILFSGTIAENISYSRPDATREEIIASAKDANAHEFISEFPMGYDTVLGEGGVGLSGSQRQRIAIARALLRNPRILILDEATSALDAASEGVVQDALDRLMRGRTTVVIAHRLSTVTGADRILVLDRGEIAEQGSFDDLVKAEGVFSALYKTQFKVRDNEQ